MNPGEPATDPFSIMLGAFYDSSIPTPLLILGTLSALIIAAVHFGRRKTLFVGVIIGLAAGVYYETQIFFDSVRGPDAQPNLLGAATGYAIWSAVGTVSCAVIGVALNALWVSTNRRSVLPRLRQEIRGIIFHEDWTPTRAMTAHDRRYRWVLAGSVIICSIVGWMVTRPEFLGVMHERSTIADVVTIGFVTVVGLVLIFPLHEAVMPRHGHPASNIDSAENISAIFFESSALTWAKFVVVLLVLEALHSGIEETAKQIEIVDWIWIVFMVAWPALAVYQSCLVMQLAPATGRPVDWKIESAAVLLYVPAAVLFIITVYGIMQYFVGLGMFLHGDGWQPSIDILIAAVTAMVFFLTARAMVRVFSGAVLMLCLFAIRTGTRRATIGVIFAANALIYLGLIAGLYVYYQEPFALREWAPFVPVVFFVACLWLYRFHNVVMGALSQRDRPPANDVIGSLSRVERMQIGLR